MDNYRVKTPVTLIVFNRPDFTQRVLEVVRKAKPYKLYIVQDGPRDSVKTDINRCNQVYNIFDTIDWDCEVHWNRSKTNLGCCKRPYTGIDWVFQNEESAIILEDDCLPSLDFFKFCDYVLEKYKNDERIMLISGTNVENEWKRSNYSYHFSSLGGIHGWASWKRAWEKYDPDINLWNSDEVKKLVAQNMDARLFYFRKDVYDCLVNNSEESSAWDYQWGLARFLNSGLAIVPNENLIKNIGYGSDSTHTSDPNCKEAKLSLGKMTFPIVDPPFVIVDQEYDQNFIKQLTPSMPRMKLRKLKKKLKTIFNL